MCGNSIFSYDNKSVFHLALSGAMGEPGNARKRTLEDLLGGAAPPAAPPPVDPAKAFEARANDVLRFRLVRCAEDMASAPLFGPEFTHQVFREDETIFGYRDLKARAAARQPARHAGRGGLRGLLWAAVGVGGKAEAR